MKITLDLLPQERKLEIKRTKRFLMILRGELLFLVPILLFVVILLSVYYILSLQRDSAAAFFLQQQSGGQYQELVSMEEKFKQTNDSVVVISKTQTGHLRWMNMFEQLSTAVPQGIYIDDLSTKNYKILLAGKAQTRESLLEFKSNLEKNDCFRDINVPLSNLVVKNDVDFQMDLSITEDCLKKNQQ